MHGRDNLLMNRGVRIVFLHSLTLFQPRGALAQCLGSQGRPAPTLVTIFSAVSDDACDFVWVGGFEGKVPARLEPLDLSHSESQELAAYKWMPPFAYSN